MGYPGTTGDGHAAGSSLGTCVGDTDSEREREREREKERGLRDDPSSSSYCHGDAEPASGPPVVRELWSIERDFL